MAPNNESLGGELARQLFEAIRELEAVLPPGAREIPVLVGVTSSGAFLAPLEEVRKRLIDLLVECRRVFLLGNTVVIEMPRRDGGGVELITLATGPVAVRVAAGLLTELAVCQEGMKQFPPPRSLIDAVFTSALLAERLPRIRYYAQRPLFGRGFVLLGPGYHGEDEVLVHGPAVEPVLHTPPVEQLPAIERLPPHLRRLLAGFCFRSDADLANYVALLLTGLLVNHFVETGKPVGLIDGNQPGLGKSLLTRVIGMLLDGRDPRVIAYTRNDEELGKRIVATLRGGNPSVLVIDNAKAQGGQRVESVVLEANSMAPEISLRILGVSQNLVRANDLLWLITMNATSLSPDMVSRGLPVRLYYAGRPEERTFGRIDPLDYARRNRQEIVGELTGMVIRWNQAGRPEGRSEHRLGPWACTIRGILEVAGLPEFLTSRDEVVASFNSELDELARLAELVVGEADLAGVDGGATVASRPLRPSDWVDVFHRAGVFVDALRAASRHSASIRAGQYLSRNLDREVSIEVAGRTGKAVLRGEDGRSRQRLYFFECSWNETEEDPASEPAGSPYDGPAAPG